MTPTVALSLKRIWSQMDLKNTRITGKVLIDTIEQMDIGIMDWSHYLGRFSAGVHRMRVHPEQPVDYVTAVLLRYLVKTFPSTGRLATTASGLAMRWRITTEHTAIHLIHELKSVYNEHPYGIEIGGERLNLEVLGHLSTILVRNQATCRSYLSGTSDLTQAGFRWFDIVISRFENSPLRNSLPNQRRKRIPDPEVDLIQEILLEEAEASELDVKTLLNKGWQGWRNS